MPIKAQRVVVIGAGIGGLVAALELAHAGLPVTVIDKGAGPGGKMRAVETAAGPVDAGPTVFSMKWVFEGLFASVGESLDAELPLEPMEVLARHHWRGAPMLDLFADPARSRDAVGSFAGARAAREFDAFSARAGRLFDAFLDPVMRAAAPTPLSVARANASRAPGLLRDMAPLSRMSGLLSRSFTDPRLAQLFGRYATYVGGSPYLSPAILALIWHAEASGVCRLPGGMVSLAHTLHRLCEARGVEFRFETTVSGIDTDNAGVNGVTLKSGESVPARNVLFNGDPAALADGLLGDAARPAGQARRRAKRSLSAWVWTFAGEPGPDTPLSHHNVYFSDNYRAEFDDLFKIGRKPLDPTLYICAHDRAPGAPPQGPERFQIIMNAPADGDRTTPTEQEIRQCETMVFSRLREAGLTLSRPLAENALTTPWDFHQMFPGTGGAIYGTAPHSVNTTFQRPTARTRIPGLYLAGGAVHPGPGVPMAALSGRQAAAAIAADRGLTSTSTRTATRGGMSTGSRTTAPAASRSSLS